MKTKLLCITMLIFTVLIFAANHYAVRNEFRSQTECSLCGACKVELVSIMGKSKEKEPSCSLVFKTLDRIDNWSVATIKKKEDYIIYSPTSCDFSVFCDRTHLAKVTCAGSDAQGPVDPAQKCSFQCNQDGRLEWTCDHWQRKQKKSEKGKKKSGSLGPTSTTSSLAFASTNISASIMSGFLPVKYGDEATDDQEAKEIITGPIRWRLIEGEAGIEKGVLTVATGEAEVQSFCTGDTIRLVGPNVISLPTCQVDISGRWQGAYARRLSVGKLAPVAVSLDLRNASGALKGELKTPDGAFNIVSARQNDTNFQLEASGSVAGKERKILLNGKLTKGVIVFDGSESDIGEKPLKLTGAVRRLYIADSGLLPAVLNQPYNFKLTVISTDNKAITLRLAGGKLPRGISLDGQSGTLSGTPTEVGIFNIRVAAEDATGNVFEQPLTLTVKKMMITTRLLPDAFVGQSYSATLRVAGGQPPYRFSGFPPKGLKLDPNTGELSGVPTSNRHEPSSFTVRDSQNNSETQDVSLQVRGTTILTSYFLPEATQGSPYRTQFQVVGNNIPTQWLMSGEADIELIGSIGLTLNRLTGELSGTPTKPGSFRLSMGAITTSVDQQYRNFTLTINSR
jgi:hypothetical protein